MHENVQWTAAQEANVQKLRSMCLAYPEAHEVQQFGHPWFKAGKRPFCIPGLHDGNLTIAFSTPKMDQDTLCQMEGFRPTPYMHQHGWTTMDLPGKADWEMIQDLVETGYRNVALKRMIAALDER